MASLQKRMKQRIHQNGFEQVVIIDQLDWKHIIGFDDLLIKNGEIDAMWSKEEQSKLSVLYHCDDCDLINGIKYLSAVGKKNNVFILSESIANKLKLDSRNIIVWKIHEDGVSVKSTDNLEARYTKTIYWKHLIGNLTVFN